MNDTQGTSIGESTRVDNELSNGLYSKYEEDQRRKFAIEIASRIPNLDVDALIFNAQRIYKYLSTGE